MTEERAESGAVGRRDRARRAAGRDRGDGDDRACARSRSASGWWTSRRRGRSCGRSRRGCSAWRRRRSAARVQELMHWGYGATGGAAFAALPDRRQEAGLVRADLRRAAVGGLRVRAGAAAGPQAGQGARLLERPALIRRPPALRPGAVGDPAAPAGVDGQRPPRAGGCGYGSRARCRAWAFAPTCTGWPASWAWRATCSTTSAACCARPRARPDAVAASWSAWPRDAPPLAVVEDVAPRRWRPPASSGFAIAASARAGEPLALVSPDVATCEACLAELLDPADRRHRYPFINCTDCGPRFTIVRGVPYDRPLTTMAGFEMCAPCRAEYEDPVRPALPRPAQRVPGVRAVAGAAGRRGGRCRGRRPARALGGGTDGGAGGGGEGARRLSPGLPARSTSGAAAALRARKHREDKPFALMAADLDGARALVELTAREEELLLGRERPIVIARRRAGARGGRGGGAGLARSRRDAALLAAAPPARWPTPARRW